VISGGSTAKLPPSSTSTSTSAKPGTAAPAGSGSGATAPAGPGPGTAAPAGPGSGAAAPAQAPRLVITIASKGEIYLDATLVRDDALPAKLRELAARRGKDMPLVIRVDKSVPAGRVVHVMDQAKLAGFSRISLAVEP
jgi:Biopolymer transport protein ExbD/TolR